MIFINSFLLKLNYATWINATPLRKLDSKNFIEPFLFNNITNKGTKIENF